MLLVSPQLLVYVPTSQLPKFMELLGNKSELALLGALSVFFLTFRGGWTAQFLPWLKLLLERLKCKIVTKEFLIWGLSHTGTMLSRRLFFQYTLSPATHCFQHQKDSSGSVTSSLHNTDSYLLICAGNL